MNRFLLDFPHKMVEPNPKVLNEVRASLYNVAAKPNFIMSPDMSGADGPNIMFR